jgi:hypothetical protein
MTTPHMRGLATKRDSRTGVNSDLINALNNLRSRRATPKQPSLAEIMMQRHFADFYNAAGMPSRDAAGSMPPPHIGVPPPPPLPTGGPQTYGAGMLPSATPTPTPAQSPKKTLPFPPAPDDDGGSFLGAIASPFKKALSGVGTALGAIEDVEERIGATITTTYPDIMKDIAKGDWKKLRYALGPQAASLALWDTTPEQIQRHKDKPWYIEKPAEILPTLVIPGAGATKGALTGVRAGYGGVRGAAAGIAAQGLRPIAAAEELPGKVLGSGGKVLGSGIRKSYKAAAGISGQALDGASYLMRPLAAIDNAPANKIREIARSAKDKLPQRWADNVSDDLTGDAPTPEKLAQLKIEGKEQLRSDFQGLTKEKSPPNQPTRRQDLRAAAGLHFINQMAIAGGDVRFAQQALARYATSQGQRQQPAWNKFMKTIDEVKYNGEWVGTPEWRRMFADARSAVDVDDLIQTPAFARQMDDIIANDIPDLKERFIGISQKELDDFERAGRNGQLSFDQRVLGLDDAEVTNIEARVQADIDQAQRPVGAGDLNRRLHRALNERANELGLPPSPHPNPFLATQFGAESTDSSGIFNTFLAMPTLRLAKAMFGKYNGARMQQGRVILQDIHDGNKLLAEHNLGKEVKNPIGIGGKSRLVEPAKLANGQWDQNDPIFLINRAIQGEGDLPDVWANPPAGYEHIKGLQPIVDDILHKRSLLQAQLVDFDPAFINTINENPEQFPRIFKRVGEKDYRRPIGAGDQPSFLMEREAKDWTTTVLKGEYEPTTWNPYEQLGLLAIEQTEYIESNLLLSALKARGLVQRESVINKLKAEATTPRERRMYSGWRTPDAGAAYRGMKLSSKHQKPVYGPKLLVPSRIADQIEASFGTRSWARKAKVRVPGVEQAINPLEAVETFTNAMKRAKLTGTIFQHFDFSMRTIAAAYSLEGIRRPIGKLPVLGGPFRHIPYMWRISLGSVRNVGEHAAYLQKRVTSEPDLKGVAEAGGNFGGDTSIVKRQILSSANLIAEEAPAGIKGLVSRRIDAINRWTETQLFDVVYGESMIFALENLILPKTRRLLPRLADESAEAWNRRVWGQAAEDMNLMFSSLGPWERAFAAPGQQDFARQLLFSSNEQESWIRMFGKMFDPTTVLKEGQLSLWNEFALGTLIGVGGIANAIHLFSTGEIMPIKKYMPISTDSYGPLPISYNSEFMAPDLPFSLRGGAKGSIDLLGQFDTGLRWIIDAPAALQARWNVGPRAIINQVKGENFYGEPLESFERRVMQFGEDTLMPIGAGNLLQTLRHKNTTLAKFIPAGDDRVGVGGGLIQSVGGNVRAEPTGEYLDRYTRRAGFQAIAADGTPTGPLIDKYADLNLTQRDQLFGAFPEILAEMNKRQLVGSARGQVWARAAVTADQSRAERMDTEKKAWQAFENGDISSESFRDRVAEAAQKAADESQVAWKKAAGGSLEKDDRPDDPMKAAVWDYYDVWTQGEAAAAAEGWSKGEMLEWVFGSIAIYEEEEWTPAQKQYVKEQTSGRVQHNHDVKVGYFDPREKYSDYWKIEPNVIRLLAKQQGQRSLKYFDTFNHWKNAKRKNIQALENEILVKNPWIPFAENMITMVKNESLRNDTGLHEFLIRFHGRALPDHMQHKDYELAGYEKEAWRKLERGQPVGYR